MSIQNTFTEQEEITLTCDINWGDCWYDIENGYIREHKDTQSGTHITKHVKLTPHLIEKIKKIKSDHSSFDVQRVEKIYELIKHEEFCKQNGL